VTVLVLYRFAMINLDARVGPQTLSGLRRVRRGT
jgi:hypothetical protein